MAFRTCLEVFREVCLTVVDGFLGVDLFKVYVFLGYFSIQCSTQFSQRRQSGWFIQPSSTALKGLSKGQQRIYKDC